MKTKKVVCITGSLGGIGEALCKAYHDSGYNVYASDITSPNDKQQNAPYLAHFSICDVSNESEIESWINQVVSKEGQLDVYINNAGIDGEQKPIWESNTENWRKVLSINLDGVYFGMKHASKVMKEQKHGHILSISSVCGIKAVRHIQPYTASKAAVNLLTESVALEVAEFNIRVNAICPSIVQTNLLDHFIASSPNPEERKKSFEHFNPLPGMITPKEIAEAAIYLSSEAARHITGVCLPLNGGYTSK